MDGKKRAFLVSVLGEEIAGVVIKTAEEKTAELERLGVRHKAADAKLAPADERLLALVGKFLGDPALSRDERAAAIQSLVYGWRDAVEPPPPLAAAAPDDGLDLDEDDLDDEDELELVAAGKRSASPGIDSGVADAVSEARRVVAEREFDAELREAVRVAQQAAGGLVAAASSAKAAAKPPAPAANAPAATRPAAKASAVAAHPAMPYLAQLGVGAAPTAAKARRADRDDEPISEKSLAGVQGMGRAATPYVAALLRQGAVQG